MKRYKHIKWSDGWSTIEAVTVRNGWLVEIGYNPNSYHPYCVQYAGNGHYFFTRDECRAYCHGRGWISYGEVYKEAPHGNL